MICKVVTIALILSISAYGSDIEHNQRLAVSSQSFNRDDVPVSYKHSTIHNYKRSNDKKPENLKEHNVYRQYNSGPVRYPSVQYAPLPHEIKPKERYEYKSVSPLVHLIETGRHVYSTNGTLKKDHLEPRLVVKNHNEHKQNYRSYIPGHNVEVLPPPTSLFFGHVDPLVTRQEKYQKQQVKAPKFVYYQKVNQNFLGTSSTFKNIEEQPTSENYNFMEFLQNEFNVPISKESRTLPYAYSLHHELALEKPVLTYQHLPRLHLNIARKYGIANHRIKAPIANRPAKATPPPTNIAKPPILTQAFFIPNIVDPLKTRMYPVRNENKPNSVYKI